MLQDNKHKLLARCSPSSARTASAKQIGALHAKYPAGLIRGALGRAHSGARAGAGRGGQGREGAGRDGQGRAGAGRGGQGQGQAREQGQ